MSPLGHVKDVNRRIVSIVLEGSRMSFRKVLLAPAYQIAYHSPVANKIPTVKRGGLKNRND